MKKILFLALAAGCGWPSLAQTNSAPVPPAAAHETLITADTADFDMGTGRRQALYKGHVQVTDPQMHLTCEWLVADLAPLSGRIDHILAETNVVIDFTDDRGQTNHATCDRAVYVFAVHDGVTNETVTLTGHARVENAQGWLTGEPIYLNLLDKSLHADNPKMILRETTGRAAAETNALPLPRHAPPAALSPPETVPGAQTNGTQSPPSPP
jgi:lipopolysaccharide export system protein LptA